jgi:tetratricopeptide (TPR) repeat protein
VTSDITEGLLNGIGVVGSVSEGRAYGPGRDAYLNGTAWLGQRTPDGIRTAIERFREAIELEAGLAFLRGDYALAIEEAREAARLEPSLVLARALEGRVLAVAGRAEECLELDLGVYRVVRALCLRAAGRTAEAANVVAEVERIVEGGDRLDPAYLNTLAMQDLSVYYGFNGDVARATTWLRRAFDQSPFGVDSRLLDSALFDRIRSDQSFTNAVREERTAAWTRVLEERRQVEGRGQAP